MNEKVQSVQPVALPPAGADFFGRRIARLILSKRPLLHGGSLRGPPFLASHSFSYKESGGLDLFKAAAGRMGVSKGCCAAAFSFAVPGRYFGIHRFVRLISYTVG